MEPIPIDDPTDERVADYVGLRRIDRLAHARGAAIAEGVTVLRRLLTSPLRDRLRSVLVTPQQLARLQPELAASEVPVLVASREVLASIAGFDVHRGVLASLERPTPLPLTELLATGKTFVALEGLNDAENLGAIARTARALGADGWLLDPTCADPFARRVIRVSMGEVLFLPTVRPQDWMAALVDLRQHGVATVALTPSASALPLSGLNVPPDRPVALLAGAEGPGLSEQSLTLASHQLRIPMRAGVDSLNVGHALAIALGRA